MASVIEKRIVKEFLKGNTLSVRNQWKVRASNISREISRRFESNYNITCKRKRINWKDDFGDGWYFEYSITDVDRYALLCNKRILNLGIDFMKFKPKGFE